jgi:lipid-binding SYLF domain-containing protein
VCDGVAQLLQHAKALFFFVEKKAGLGVGVKRGHGFCIARLPNGTWSAPVFMCKSTTTVGITAGARSVRHHD